MALKSLLTFVIVVLGTAASGNELRAQVIDLECKGPVNQYEPKKILGIAGDGGTRVNPDQNRITAPFGEFRITQVEETKIYFDDPSSALEVSGTLDRIAGQMTIFWRRPKEVARVSMYADLKCSIAKRLF
jgi:hypothetical protein